MTNVTRQKKSKAVPSFTNPKEFAKHLLTIFFSLLRTHCQKSSLVSVQPKPRLLKLWNVLTWLILFKSNFFNTKSFKTNQIIQYLNSINF
jgi:hypothetical protein